MGDDSTQTQATNPSDAGLAGGAGQANVSLKTQPTPTTGDHSKREFSSLAIILLILVAIGAGAVLLQRSPSPTNSTTTTQTVTTSIPPLNNSVVSGFVSAFNFPNSSAHVELGAFNNNVCNETNFLKIEFFGPFPPNMLTNNITTAINFSLINQTNPFQIQLRMAVINQSSLSSYRTSVANNGGYCEPSINRIRHNSTFVSTGVNFTNKNGTLSPGYLMHFTNYTARGLADASIYYVGKKPDISLYTASVLHRNVQIIVAFWGIDGNLKANDVLSLTNVILQEFETKSG